MGRFDVAGRQVVVVGAARSGLAAAELLVARGARVSLTDARETLPGAERLEAMGIRLALGGRGLDVFDAADLVVMSPGVPPEQPAIAAARQRGVPVIAEIELASRWLQGRVIAITGTKGKSTTTTLVGRMLAAGGFDVTVGGNIGEPLAGQVARTSADTIHVVEASSFQLELVDTFHAWIAVVMNLSADHLDRHGTFEAYRAAKARVFGNQAPGDWAVLNADDLESASMAAGSPAARRWFSRSGLDGDGTVVDAGWIVERRDGRVQRLVPLSAIHLLGSHLVADVMAAATVASIVGVSPEAMTTAVEGFRGLEHAMELVADIGGVRFVNDSKATNVESAIRAIESFDGGLVPILGGRFKGGDVRLLREPLAQRARAAVVIGEARTAMSDALADVVEVIEAASMEAAVAAAYERARPTGVVLLAPACASFDMFRDYAERGRRFKEEVARLAPVGDADPTT